MKLFLNAKNGCLDKKALRRRVVEITQFAIANKIIFLNMLSHIYAVPYNDAFFNMIIPSRDTIKAIFVFQ